MFNCSIRAPGDIKLQVISEKRSQPFGLLLHLFHPPRLPLFVFRHSPVPPHRFVSLVLFLLRFTGELHAQVPRQGLFRALKSWVDVVVFPAKVRFEPGEDMNVDMRHALSRRCAVLPSMSLSGDAFFRVSFPRHGLHLVATLLLQLT